MATVFLRTVNSYFLAAEHLAMVEKFKAVSSLSLIQPEDNDSSGGMSSSTGMTDIQENTWYIMTFTVQTTRLSYQSWITILKRYCPLDQEELHIYVP